jgi:hypothetical protein
MRQDGELRGKAAQKASRGRRLSAALRENLKRRKAQIRAHAPTKAAVGRPGSHDSAGFAAEKRLSPDPRRPAGED